MSKHPKQIYGYLFDILVEKGEEGGFIALCPGVGGVYEEGRTEEEARANAYQGAVAILSSRIKDGKPLVEESQHLKILTSPPNVHDMPAKDRDNYIATIPQIPCPV